MHHLSFCMDASIGTAGGGEHYGLRRDLRHGGAEDILDGTAVGLALPANESGAVVFDAEGDAPQALSNSIRPSAS